MANNNFESYSLVWLDAKVNQSKENLDVQQRLRSLMGHLKLFEEVQSCKEYIQSVSLDDRIILIASGRLGEELVPQIHSLRQLSNIYVYCSDRKKNEQWAKKFHKIKCVTNQIDELISRIQSDEKQTRITEPIAISIFNPSSAHGQSTGEVNGEFVHTQLLLDALLRMKSTKNERDELISLCRKEYQTNAMELNVLQEFEKDYVTDRALWWYTRESFLYRLMNKALRLQNVDMLYLFRFFIRDIGKQLESHRCPSSTRLYRGQLMSKSELEMLKKSLGQLISVNSFLSTSTNRHLALSFLQSSSSSDDLQKILFEIQADPDINATKSFANITSFSYFPGEDEVLMMLGSIFRLENIRLNDDRIWILEITLCGDDEHDLQAIYEHLHARLEAGETSLYSFGQVLRDMGKFDAAEKYMHRFLDESPSRNHRDIAIACHALGVIMDEKGDYHASLQWHQKSVDTYTKILKSNDPTLADVYNCLAVVYRKTGDYKHALEAYEKAMKIFRQAFGDDHFKIAMCWNNIGVVYYEDKKYARALEYYQKALMIWQQHLPANHSHFGAVYNNLGEVYRHLRQYDRALEVHHQSLRIYEKSLSSEHPDVATTLENIGLVYEQKGDMKQTMVYFEKAAKVFRHSLPPTHPDVIRIGQDIERVLSKKH